MEGLTEGRMVHFVLDNGNSPAPHRPAIIVQVWNQDTGCANLIVLVDGRNDYSELRSEGVQTTIWKTSILYSDGKEPGTWHWIEKA